MCCIIHVSPRFTVKMESPEGATAILRATKTFVRPRDVIVNVV